MFLSIMSLYVLWLKLSVEKNNHVGSIAPLHVPGWGVFETPHAFLFEAAD